MKTKLTSVTYLGFTAMDRRFSNAMLPWLLREIRATGVKDKLSVAVEDGYLKAYNGVFEPVIVHRLVDIIRASQVPGRPEELFYLLLNEKEGLLNCYLFRTATVDQRKMRSVWTPLARQAAVFYDNSTSNAEFWLGTLLILLACELDLIYYHILNRFDLEYLR